MTLAASLHELLREHDRLGSPLRRFLRPGVPGATVETALRDLGLAVNREVVEWYGWCDGLDRAGWQQSVGARPPPTLLWPAQPLSLAESVARYRDVLPDALGPTEFAALLEQLEPATPLTGFWVRDWFPLTIGDEYAAEVGTGVGATAAVWRVNWHPDPEFPTANVASSLEELIERVVGLFRAGAYRWDAAAMAIVPDDVVFASLGRGLARP